MDKRPNELSLVLYNLRSAYNTGAIFRTADGAGVSRIYLIGTTPRPVDRFGRINEKIAKTALGAEKVIDWRYGKTINPFLKKWTEEGKRVWALEQTKDSVDYREVKIDPSAVLVLGEEKKGLPKSVLDKCHQVIEIPMAGRKESLNVAVAAGVAVFRLLED